MRCSTRKPVVLLLELFKVYTHSAFILAALRFPFITPPGRTLFKHNDMKLPSARQLPCATVFSGGCTFIFQRTFIFRPRHFSTTFIFRH
ncbi:hypothetical protein Dda3937_04386 [Dickeya dadantii 3937]|uniref:Uncharacterized protein n=1 Tax=Dickeya dadantii (strain 3937) TaxID=198628 RepID=E0SC92_DICD3|nr:hypothetical protein Dda3937_04386 [Dickeya dadantii 3937]